MLDDPDCRYEGFLMDGTALRRARSLRLDYFDLGVESALEEYDDRSFWSLRSCWREAYVPVFHSGHFSTRRAVLSSDSQNPGSILSRLFSFRCCILACF